MDNIAPNSSIVLEKATENMMLLYLFISNTPHIINIIPIEAINGTIGVKELTVKLIMSQIILNNQN